MRSSESGSSPAGSVATRTGISAARNSPPVRIAAFCPAPSASNTSVTLSATFFRICTCSAVNAVPWLATAVGKPQAWQRMTSICPSQTIASRRGALTMFGAAWSSANRMLDFLKMGVSGELTYFAAFLSFVRMRPENATGRPARSRIVNMSRPAKRL